MRLGCCDVMLCDGDAMENYMMAGVRFGSIRYTRTELTAALKEIKQKNHKNIKYLHYCELFPLSIQIYAVSRTDQSWNSRVGEQKKLFIMDIRKDGAFAHCQFFLSEFLFGICYYFF